MDAIKSFILTSFVICILLVAMAQMPMLQGMPVEQKLAHMSRAVIDYTAQMISPIVNLFYQYIY